MSFLYLIYFFINKSTYYFTDVNILMILRIFTFNFNFNIEFLFVIIYSDYLYYYDIVAFYLFNF
jgi:hypothetical protein